MRPVAYLVIRLGCVLDFAVSVIPNDQVGYKLDMAALLIGLLPYVVYGTFTDIVRGWLLAVSGFVILAIDLLVKIPERFAHYDGFADHAVYYAPLISTFVVLPILLGIGVKLEKRWWGEPGASAAARAPDRKS